MNTLNFMEKLLDGVAVEWKALGEVGNFIRGLGIQKSDFTESGAGCIHYGQIHTHYGTWAVETKSFIKPEFAARLRKTHTGDLVIATTSEDDAAVAKAVAWLGEEEVAVSTDAYIYRHTCNPKYMSYFFQTEHFQSQKKPHITGTKVRRISGDSLAKIPIPIPCPENPEKSLKIQTEIVRILDAFTELTTRKKQYNYYRDKLLSFKNGTTENTENTEGVEVEWKTLGEIVHMRAGQHISAKNIMPEPTEDYLYPCFRGNGIRGFVNTNSHDGKHLFIGRQRALCGNVQRMNGKFYATEHAVVVTAKRAVNIDWCFHMLTHMNLNQYASKSAQPGLAVGKIESLKIPVPPLAEQARIVSILDKFDALTNSITEGLPRELELRQKQYEYYRDLLLSFPKAGE